jgi:DNA-binding response OmpR family regulator
LRSLTAGRMRETISAIGGLAMSLGVLVVEDDEALAEVEVAFLNRIGYRDVTIFHRAAGVVEWVRQHKPQLILLDLMLPDRSGYDVCEELKLDRDTNRIPIIIATARTLHSDLLRGLRVGANFYLTKPFGMDQLRQAIDHVLAWRAELERTGANGEIHFELKSDTNYLKELNHMLSSLFLYTPLNEDQIFQLTTAVREMGANAIEWGNRNQVDRPVTVTYRIDQEKVTIMIRDSGTGFDRTDLAHAAREDDPAAHLDVRESRGLRAGGFGIFMARGLVDDLQYNDAGNEVRLIKRFTPTPTASS